MVSRPVNILIVEDEVAHQELVRLAFEDSGDRFSLAMAQDLGQARERLAEAQPDLVITDLRLPDGKGTEILDSGEQPPAFPLVVMTSHGDEQAAVDAIKAGAIDYVVKSEAALEYIPHVAERALREWQHIVERRQAEAAVRESEERYRTLVETATDGIILVAGGRITYANPSFRRMLGYAEDELMDLPVERVLPNTEKGKERVLGYARGRLAGKKDVPAQYEAQLATKDGDVLDVMLSASAFMLEGEQSILVIIKDISEQKQAEEALRQGEKKFRTLYESMNEGVALHDICYGDDGKPIDYKIIDVNPAYERITGLSREETIGKLASELYGADVPPHLATYVEVAETGNPAVLETYFAAIKKHLSISAFSPEKGGFATAATDITARRQAQEALTRSQQLAAVGTLAGGIAHEFNNLNAIVLGNLELTLRSQELNAKDRRRLEAMQQAVVRAIDVTKDLLAFARQEKSVQRPTSLIDVVQGTLGVVGRELETEGIEIVVRSRPIPQLVLDAGQIGQTLMNLLINARHAMLDSPEKTLTVELGTEGERAFVRFTDTGVGIPAESLPDLFLPFFTTKGEHATGDSPLAKVQGTGLGLSVCTTIVRDHGGEITVESQPGEGSSFTVWLPIPTAPLTPDADDEPVPAAHILVVDDEEMIRLLLTEVLEDAGHSVEATDDARQALELVENGAFDVIILDLQMPKMSGVDFLRAVRRIDLDQLPAVLVATGKFTDENLQGYAGLGVFETIYKPFDWGVVLPRIADALRARQVK